MREREDAAATVRVDKKPAHAEPAHVPTQQEGFSVQIDLARKWGIISSHHAPEQIEEITE
jgi:hypothetical protein